MLELDELVRVTRALGNSRYFVQGGGGNTSIEIGELTFVKGSGLALSQVAVSSFVPFYHRQVLDGLPSCADEESYVSLVSASVLRDGREYLRPSIETGFHSVLGKAVLHSHSIWTNLLACSYEGQNLARELLPSATWVEYARPGLPIAMAMRSQAESASRIYILENHGLIVCAPTLLEAWELHETVNGTVQKALGFTADAFDRVETTAAQSSDILFPDQAVYFASRSLRESKAGIETEWAYCALRAGMQARGLTPRFLSRSEADALLEMESERFRQKVSQS
jgi:rhamnose utilization protein RhaD (predicted bifunctional aldolase and dehydrogenase)